VFPAPLEFPVLPAFLARQVFLALPAFPVLPAFLARQVFLALPVFPAHRVFLVLQAFPALPVSPVRLAFPVRLDSQAPPAYQALPAKAGCPGLQQAHPSLGALRQSHSFPQSY
jgi:hypothetical protein